jgi:Na+-translocating ferredoxin:NAD+ oxidoreductase subunit D
MSAFSGPAISSAPFAFKPRTTSSLAWGTAAALAPAIAWGLYSFGPAAALPLLCSVAAALAGEALVGALAGRFTLWDGTAFLTGLLVGLSMPPGTPPAVPAAASLFAVAVVKGAFGGLGSNWMNPALAGVAFALLNWPLAMSAWTQPLLVDGFSGATPLALARSAAHASGSGPLDFLFAGGALSSATDGAVTDALNRGLFSRLGADLPSGYVDLLLGNKGGAIGEVSGLLILASSIVLLARRMIRWEIPASIIASFSLAAWAFGGLAGGGGLFSGDVLFSLLTGSILLIAFFMAPDPVTSPSSRGGMLAYGAGVGLAAFALRSLGSATEGSAFAVIIMNCAVPALTRLDLAAARRRSRGAAGGRRDEAGDRGGDADVG